jgi:FlaA1/EpsC-like NDP-sugar epimerase
MFRQLTSPIWRAVRRCPHKMRGLAADLILLEIALITAFLLRFEFAVPEQLKATMGQALMAWFIIKGSVSLLFPAHLSSWRHFSTPDAARLVLARMAGSAAVSIAVLSACPYAFPRSVLALDFALAVLFTAGARAAFRILAESGIQSPARGKRPVFVYGAGSGAAMLLREARHNTAFPYQVRGIVDDNTAKRNMLVHGERVLGTGGDLPRLARTHSVDEVIIAVPSASSTEMTRMISNCQAAGVAYRTMPALSEVITGRGLTRQIRDVALDDVLGRSAQRHQCQTPRPRGSRDGRRRLHRIRALPADRRLQAGRSYRA